MVWFYAVGRWIVDALHLSGQRLGELALFVLILVFGFVVGKMLSLLLRSSVLRPPRVDDAVARLVGHVAVLGVFLLAFSAALTLFGTDIAQIATGLGLLTLALGFGMQNTVANLMGGVSLAIDKPFRPGDRIEVGKYWGTVQQIGLRSTRILTPRKETVIVPNKLLEEREIWNYTLFSAEFRLDVDVPIAYDADWRTAEKILLDAAREHPNTLHYRPAAVLMRRFGESAVELQLRCWIADVTVRNETMSDLLKSIKDRFEQANIEVPLPHRVVIEKKIVERAHKPLEPYARFRQVRRKVLVLLMDPGPEPDMAVFAVSLAKALGAGVVGLVVQTREDRTSEGELPLRSIGEVARGQRIWFKPLIRRGATANVAVDVARDEDVDLVLVEPVRQRFSWRRPVELTDDLRRELKRPVFAIPPEFQLNPTLVETLRQEVEAFRAQSGNGSKEAPSQSVTPGA